MKREDVAAFRRGIELIGELCFDACRFIRKGKRLPPLRINIEQASSVLARLLLDASQRVTFGLRFDCAYGFTIDEEKVIDFVAVLEQALANRDPPARRQV